MTERSAGAENSARQGVLRNAPQLSRLYLEAVRAADVAGAYRVASSALNQGMTTPELYQRVITPAMHEVGVLWEKGALTVADEHQATALTHRVLAALRPSPRAQADARGSSASPRRRVMLAAVEEEQHALGLQMAADILEDVGFHTIYLGADVPTEALLQTIDSLSPDLVALTVTMPELASRLDEVVGAVRGVDPEMDLLLGGQAARRSSGTGMLVQDLEALPAKMVRFG